MASKKNSGPDTKIPLDTYRPSVLTEKNPPTFYRSTDKPKSGGKSGGKKSGK